MTTTRAWRRRLIRLTLCLLLGLVTTVGVALASALRHRGPPETWPTHVHGGISGAGQIWYIQFAESRDATFVSIEVQRFVVPELPSETLTDASEHSPLTFRRALEQTAAKLPVSDLSQTPAMRWGSVRWAITPGPPESDWATNVFLNHAYGWPSRALWCMVGAEDAMDAGHIAVDNGAISTQWGVVPVNVRLRGVVVNTLFYAVPWWVLLVAPGALKRWRRKRRGACLACGYDLRGLSDAEKGTSVCPECGT